MIITTITKAVVIGTMYSQKKSNNNNKNHHIVKTMKTILTIISINDTITGIITTSKFTIEF